MSALSMSQRKHSPPRLCVQSVGKWTVSINQYWDGGGCEAGVISASREKLHLCEKVLCNASKCVCIERVSARGRVAIATGSSECMTRAICLHLRCERGGGQAGGMDALHRLSHTGPFSSISRRLLDNQPVFKTCSFLQKISGGNNTRAQ